MSKEAVTPHILLDHRDKLIGGDVEIFLNSEGKEKGRRKYRGRIASIKQGDDCIIFEFRWYARFLKTKKYWEHRKPPILTVYLEPRDSIWEIAADGTISREDWMIGTPYIYYSQTYIPKGSHRRLKLKDVRPRIRRLRSIPSHASA